MKEAIEVAIKNGWNKKWMFISIYKNTVEFATGTLKGAPHVVTKQHLSFQEILLDPLFWQCLGKGIKPTKDMTIATCSANYKGNNQFEWIFEWNFQWHRFIDHLASGKDIESFFKELLTNKK